MSVTTSLSGEQTEGNDSPEDSATSEHGTICEEIYEQEQSFTTAPGSLSPSANPMRFRTLSPEISRDTERAQSTPSYDEDNLWRRRMINPPLAQLAEEEWVQVTDALNHWSDLAEKGKAEVMKHR